MNFVRLILNKRSFLLGMILLLPTILPNLATAIDPQVVTLLYFRGDGLDNAVHLEWATGSELDTAGFRLERSSSLAGPFVFLDDIGWINSEAPPDGLSGAVYDVIDDSDIINDSAYWYRLVEFESDGSENRTEPISVTAGLTVPTSTATRTPTQSSPSESTPTPGASQTATSTPNPGSTSSLQTTPVPNRPTIISVSPTLESDALEAEDNTVASLVTNQTTTAESSLGNIAQEEPTVTGYPAPATPFMPLPGAADLGNGYPGIDRVGRGNSPAAYPSFTDDNRSGRAVEPLITLSPDPDLAVIGNGNRATLDNNQVPSGQNPGSTLMLWIGLLAASVIFIAGVIGSAYFYRRHGSNTP